MWVAGRQKVVAAPLLRREAVVIGAVQKQRQLQKVRQRRWRDLQDGVRRRRFHAAPRAPCPVEGPLGCPLQRGHHRAAKIRRKQTIN